MREFQYCFCKCGDQVRNYGEFVNESNNIFAPGFGYSYLTIMYIVVFSKKKYLFRYTCDFIKYLVLFM